MNVSINTETLFDINNGMAQQNKHRNSQQPQPEPHSAFYLDQSSIACKAGCGFFGNPEWLGYCSICFKQLNTNRQYCNQTRQLPRSISVSGDQHQPDARAQQLHQDNQQKRPQPLSQEFQNMSLDAQSDQKFSLPSPSSDHLPDAVNQVTRFASHMFRQSSYAWLDCLRHTNKFAKELLAEEKLPDTTINHLSDKVHEFYQTMNDRYENQFIYKGISTEQIDMLNDNMERILNEHIYQVISTRIINEDEEHNMAIQKRIRSLNWITVEHLEIDIDFMHPAVHDLLDKAICQMIEMNSRTSSIDKLDCIVQCSKTIFELLQVNPTGGNIVPVSADQFLPVLVFVVIQANPPMLPADMKYLTRFSNPRRLMSGETGYYFTNLCCALEFIEKASGASLNISEEEFNSFVNGEAIPKTKSQFNTYLCDGLRTMCSNDAALIKLRQSNELRQSKVESIFEQIDVHLETYRVKLEEMQAFAINIKQKLKPNLPMFYYNEVLPQNKELAQKLLPSYLRKSDTEEKLIDIDSIPLLQFPEPTSSPSHTSNVSD